jgi:hypothetical protein
MTDDITLNNIFCNSQTQSVGEKFRQRCGYAIDALILHGVHGHEYRVASAYQLIDPLKYRGINKCCRQYLGGFHVASLGGGVRHVRLNDPLLRNDDNVRKLIPSGTLLLDYHV